jgi:hypothetical protein
MSFREVFAAAGRMAIRWYSLRNISSRNQWWQRYQECYDKFVTGEDSKAGRPPGKRNVAQWMQPSLFLDMTHLPRLFIVHHVSALSPRFF